MFAPTPLRPILPALSSVTPSPSPESSPLVDTPILLFDDKIRKSPFSSFEPQIVNSGSHDGREDLFGDNPWLLESQRKRDGDSLSLSIGSGETLLSQKLHSSGGLHTPVFFTAMGVDVKAKNSTIHAEQSSPPDSPQSTGTSILHSYAAGSNIGHLPASKSMATNHTAGLVVETKSTENVVTSNAPLVSSNARIEKSSRTLERNLPLTQVDVNLVGTCIYAPNAQSNGHPKESTVVEQGYNPIPVKSEVLDDDADLLHPNQYSEGTVILWLRFLRCTEFLLLTIDTLSEQTDSEPTPKRKRPIKQRYYKFIRYSKQQALRDTTLDVKRLRTKCRDIKVCNGEVIQIDVDTKHDSDFTCDLCSISEYIFVSILPIVSAVSSIPAPDLPLSIDFKLPSRKRPTKKERAITYKLDDADEPMPLVYDYSLDDNELLKEAACLS